MTEADLTEEAGKLFREMGMVDLPHDALDFFQNLENGASDDWKKCLKTPGRGARRTSSDGIALVHLKKKYSTGLVQEQHQSTRNIKASDIDGSTTLPRKLPPSSKQNSRFGYSTAKVADVKLVSPTSSCSEEGANKAMTRPHKAAAHVVGRHHSSTRSTSPKPGCISTLRPINKILTLPLTTNQERPSSVASSDVHNSVLRTGYTPTHTRSRSHSSAVTTTANFFTHTGYSGFTKSNLSNLSIKKKTPEGEKARSIEREPSEEEKARLAERKTPEVEKARSIERKTPEAEKARSIERKIPEREKARSIERKTPEREKARSIERKTPEREKARSIERKTPEREKVRLIERKTPEREKARSIERKTLEREKARSIERKTPEREKVRSIEREPSEGVKARLIERKTPEREKVRSIERKTPEREKAILIERKTPEREKTRLIKRNPSEGEKARLIERKTQEGIERKTPEKDEEVILIERMSPKREMSNTADISDSMQVFIPVPSQAAPVKLEAATGNVETRSPDEVKEDGRNEGAKSNTQVLQSLKTSFKVIPVSSSSHRIMHVVQDGGAPKRHNSMNRRPLPLSSNKWASFDYGPAKSASTRPTLDNVILRQEKNIDRLSQSSSARPNIMVYHSIDDNATHKMHMVKDKNVVRGGVDISSSPMQNSTAAQKEEPVDSNVNGSSNGITGGPGATTTSDSMVSEICTDKPTVMKTLEVTSSIGITEQSSVVIRSLMKCNSPSISRASPVGEPMSNEITGVGTSRQESSGHDSSAPISGTKRKEGQPSNDKATQHAPRNLPDKKTLRRPIHISGNKNGEKTSVERQLVHSLSPPRSTVPTAASSSTNIPGRKHKRLQISLSDTSPILSTHTPPVVSLESVDDTLLSSISSTNLNSVPQLDHFPLSECVNPLLVSEERQAKLKFNWSNQSLNEKMKNVATTTVAALSNLVEVLTSPPIMEDKDRRLLHCGAEEDTPTDTKWYIGTENEDNYRSSSPSNPLSPVSSTTSPTFMSVSYLLSNVKSDSDTNIPKGRREMDSASPLDVIIGTSLPNKDASRTSARITSNGRSDTQVQRDSQIDGNIMSKITSRQKIGSSKLSVPPIPPRSETARQFTSSTSPEEYYFKSSFIAPNNTCSLSSSTSSSSYYSYRRPQSRGSSSEPSDMENKISLRTTEEQRVSDSWSRQSAYSESYVPEGSSNQLDHDYAVLEPSAYIAPADHDYAILDPEYHDEFYGYCVACLEPIIGMENGCLALDKTFHIKCFTCSTCGIELRGCNFYTFQGKFLCDKEVVYEQCHSCKKSIHARVIRTLGFAYHPKCFRCTVCGCCLDGVHYTSDAWNKLYCIHDYHKIFSRKCVVCDHPIISQNGQKKSLQVIAMNKSYHIKCYKCELHRGKHRNASKEIHPGSPHFSRAKGFRVIPSMHRFLCSLPQDCHQQLASKTGGGEKCYPLNGHLLCKTCNTLRVQVPESYRVPAPQRESITSH